ncbi:DUF7282 domain-containing protein [Haloarcula litorea]|uniref:DUF7282 domain-containing protein n=1 Tax=Haloarcula litorea TaxID=3032579 RepID=UPI0023E7A91F|nr:BGTF surface domain-containing protein [Halomicroarcula sp. GDY20]
MTDTSEKIRSLFLTALMVFSVIGGSIAFAGSAAAANNGSLTLTPNDNEEAGPTQYDHSADLELDSDQSLYYVDVDFTSDSSANVDLSDVSAEDIQVQTPQGDRTQASDFTDVTKSNGVLSFKLSNSIDGLSDEDTVQVIVDDVDNPVAASGGSTYTFEVSYRDSSDSQFDSNSVDYTISNTGGEAGTPDIRKATHYVPTDAPSGEGSIEIAFNEDIIEGSTGDESIVVGYENGSESDNLADSASIDADSGRLVVDLNAVITNVQNVTVSGYEDEASNEMDEQTVDLVFAPSTVDMTSDGTDEQVDDEAFQGANVALEGTVNDEFRIQGADDDNSQVDLTRGSGTHSQVYVLDTDNLDTGDYDVENTDVSDIASENQINRTLRLNNLGLEVSADENTFQTDENVTATVESNAIDRDVDAELVDSNGDVEEEVTVRIDSDGNAEADFGEIDTGNYTVNATDVNTGVTATSDEFEVVDAGDASVSFNQSVVTEQQGDIVEVVVNLQNTDTATVQIGDYTDDNYNITGEVEDGDGDGQVTVEFNSYTAGAVSGDEVVSVADSDDEITNVSQGGEFTDVAGRDAGENLLEPSDYDLLVEAGAMTGTTVDDEDAVATLSLAERSTDATQVWTAPEDDLQSLQDAEASEVYDYIAANNLTQADTVAQSDTVVVQVQASGLEGALAATADDTTDAYIEATGAYDSDSTADPIQFQFEEVTTAANAVPDTVTVGDLDSDEVSVIYDEANDSHFLVVDSDGVTDEFNGHESGDEYEANFTVYDNTELSEDNVTVNDTFAIEDRDATLNGGNDIVVQSATGQSISGTTNLAPGSEVTVRIRDDADTAAFLKQPDATVGVNGSFTATADFSDVSPGTNFTAQTRIGSSNVGDSVDGTVTSGPAASVIISDQESNGETVTVDSVTLSEGGFVAIHLNNASGDVIGASDYLESGTHEDVEITLDSAQDEDFTAVAMPHLDTDDDQTYDFPDNDGPYTANGSAITDSANVTVVSEDTDTETEAPDTDTETEAPDTDTETEMPDTDTETETDEPTTTGSSGPGFTAIVALVALLAAALLAARRDN